MLSITSTLRLNNGVEIPRLGLGTFRTESGLTAQNAVRWALETGYRHFDTAAAYGNEQDVGLAVAQSGIPREQVFITTKVANDSHGYQTALDACEASLKRLGMDYIDLYLIHWPVRELRGQTWKALLKLYEQGKCRAIGVSNYTIRHLEELLPTTPLPPATNQVEINPFLYRKELMDYCHSRGIPLTAYCPLARALKLDDPRLVALAARYQKTPAQLAIRWSLQHGMIVIPKSVHRERILENGRIILEGPAQDLLEDEKVKKAYLGL